MSIKTALITPMNLHKEWLSGRECDYVRKLYNANGTSWTLCT